MLNGIVPDGVLEYLRPLSEFKRLRSDSTYFLKNDGSFVFTEGYCHPSDGLYGKVIYYPADKGITKIFGKTYGNSTKRHDDAGNLTLIPHDEQLQIQLALGGASKDRSKLPPFAELRVEFPYTELAGYFDHRHSLHIGRTKFAEVDAAIQKVKAELELPDSRIGCTGSLMFGNFEGAHGAVHDDLDMIFFGTMAQNRKLLATIREITGNDPARRVIEFGKYWPIRFYIDDIMVCSFFGYDDPDEIPLKDVEISLVDPEEVVLEGVVGDDSHAIYNPPILGLTDVLVDGIKHPDTSLVIYDGSMRGDFFEGDFIKAKCKRIDVKGKSPLANKEVFLLNISKKVIETKLNREF